MYLLLAGFIFASFYLGDASRAAVPKIPFYLISAFLLYALLLVTITRYGIHNQLYRLSIVYAFVLYGFAVCLFGSDGFFKQFPKILIVLACIECVVVLTHLKTTREGLLGVRLHSGLLISSGWACLLAEIKKTSHRSRRDNVFFAVLSILFFLVPAVQRNRMCLVTNGILPLLYVPQKWKVRTALATAALVAGYFAFFSSSARGVFRLSPHQLVNAGGRFSIWKTALMAFVHRPLLGYGIGQFETAYRLYQQPSSHILRYEWSTIFAHNGFLQVLVETGLVGFGLFFGTLYVVIRPLIEKKWMRSEGRGWLTGCSLAYLLQAMVNYTVILPFHGLVVAAMVGAAASYPAYRGGREGRLLAKRIVWGSALVVGFFVVLNGVSVAIRQTGRWDLALRLMPIDSGGWYERAQKETDPARSLVDVTEALKWDRADAFAWNRRARLEMEMNGTDLNLILADFRRSEAWAPKHAPFYIDEGIFLLSQNASMKALDRILIAHRLEPRAPLPAYLLGLIHLRANRKPDAVRYVTLANENLRMYGSEVMGHARPSNYARFLFAVDGQKIDNLLQQLKS